MTVSPVQSGAVPFAAAVSADAPAIVPVGRPHDVLPFFSAATLAPFLKAATGRTARNGSVAAPQAPEPSENRGTTVFHYAGLDPAGNAFAARSLAGVPQDLEEAVFSDVYVPLGHGGARALKGGPDAPVLPKDFDQVQTALMRDAPPPRPARADAGTKSAALDLLPETDATPHATSLLMSEKALLGASFAVFRNTHMGGDTAFNTLLAALDLGLSEAVAR